MQVLQALDMANKILLIEDEEYLTEMYKAKFERGGYQVIVAPDGKRGTELAVSEQPNLILLDLVMPKMDGYQVLEKLKGDSRTKGLKVYILSNLGQDDEINKGFKFGADGYLIKSSLTPSQLVDSVNKIFNGETPGIKKFSFASNSRKRAAKAKADPKAGSGLGKILLIEDEEAIINMYKLRLEKAGFEVEIAKNGAWGLKLAGQKPFDLIVMDMIMPAMDGCEAIKKLKLDSRTKNVPIIVLSNSAQDRDIVEAKKCGAARYLLKSQVTPTRLSKEIDKVLAKLKKLNSPQTV